MNPQPATRNPVVIIAMQGRHQLVKINLELLAQQNCHVVVVASLQEDFTFLKSQISNLKSLTIVSSSNYPLGSKWQKAVDTARILGANPLITLGSDDFLSQNFIEKACLLACPELAEGQNHDFIYFTKWHIYDQNSGKTYKLRYKNPFPLGSGRVFSGHFLSKKHWQLFDTSMNHHLDDFVWDNIHATDNILCNPPDMHLLSIKGTHPTMNTLEKILSAESIIWDFCDNVDEQMNYTSPIKKIFS